MPSVLPNDFTLLTNQVVRIPLAQACTVAKKLAEGQMAVRYAQIFGKHRPWLELRADYGGGSYTLVFGLDDEREKTTNLWVVLTPSGKVYSVDHGDGNPANVLTTDHFSAIDKFIPEPPGHKIVVSTYYRVERELAAGGRSGCGPMMDHGSAGPKGLSFPTELAGYRVEFTELKDAEAVAEKLRNYLSDQQEKTKKVKTKEMKKK